MVEAAVDQRREHLRRHVAALVSAAASERASGRGRGAPATLLLLTPMNSFICFRSMRCCSSRCSAAVRPRLRAGQRRSGGQRGTGWDWGSYASMAAAGLDLCCCCSRGLPVSSSSRAESGGVISGCQRLVVPCCVAVAAQRFFSSSPRPSAAGFGCRPMARRPRRGVGGARISGVRATHRRALISSRRCCIIRLRHVTPLWPVRLVWRPGGQPGGRPGGRPGGSPAAAAARLLPGCCRAAAGCGLLAAGCWLLPAACPLTRWPSRAAQGRPGGPSTASGPLRRPPASSRAVLRPCSAGCLARPQAGEPSTATSRRSKAPLEARDAAQSQRPRHRHKGSAQRRPRQLRQPARQLPTSQTRPSPARRQPPAGRCAVAPLPRCLAPAAHKRSRPVSSP